MVFACDAPNVPQAEPSLERKSSTVPAPLEVNKGLAQLIEDMHSDVGEISNAIVFREPIDVQGLDMLTELAQLQCLELYRCQFAPSEFVLRVSSWPNLKRLRLEGCPMDDQTVGQICRAKELEILNLPSANISDDGLNRIARLPRLELLRIGGPNITDEGISSLSQATRLRFLHLMRVPITDAGLKTFYGMTWLESLYIDGGNETEDGIRKLLKRNPGIHFHRNQLHIADDPNADGH